MTAKPPADESAYTRGCQKQTGRRGNIAQDKTDRSEKRINARSKSRKVAGFRDRITRHLFLVFAYLRIIDRVDGVNF